ncbi:hypothetical protein [Nonomuraea dietziae]|uniref:hypothetical protein n=1 Tax=Nonomuraea dietziae TaxID=65515 RepID=UPI0031E1FB28
MPAFDVRLGLGARWKGFDDVVRRGRGVPRIGERRDDLGQLVEVFEVDGEEPVVTGGPGAAAGPGRMSGEASSEGEAGPVERDGLPRKLGPSAAGNGRDHGPMRGRSVADATTVSVIQGSAT